MMHNPNKSQAIIKDYLDGIPLLEIMEKFDISRQRIYFVLKRGNVERNRIKNPCLKCGRCCALDVELVCGIDDVPEDMVELREDGFIWMIQKNGMCAAYENNKCSIYKNRPLVCKQFEIGCCKCNELRSDNAN